MYEKVNKLGITENHVQVLTLFTNGFDREYYIREVQKLLNVSPRTAQLVLEDLEGKTVLESQTRGKIKVYRLRKSMMAREYLILAEEYKRISFLEKNNLIREIVEKIIPHIKGIAVVFGSYAKGIQKEDSDVDVFIAGDYNKSKIDNISKMYGVNISVKKYPLDLFEKEIRSDPLLKEIIENHVVVSGTESFINIVLQ